MRADSGFYSHVIVAVCRDKHVLYSITVRLCPRLRNLIDAILGGGAVGVAAGPFPWSRPYSCPGANPASARMDRISVRRRIAIAIAIGWVNSTPAILYILISAVTDWRTSWLRLWHCPRPAPPFLTRPQRLTYPPTHATAPLMTAFAFNFLSTCPRFGCPEVR